jgi:hypothetical protein
MGNGHHYVLSVSGEMIHSSSWHCRSSPNNSISGRHPYVAKDKRSLLETIRSQKLRFDCHRFRHLTLPGLRFFNVHKQCQQLISGRSFVQQMLVYDTVHRRAMGELIVHPWLTVGRH